MLKIRSCHDHLIFNMGIPMPGKDVFYIETGPWRLCTTRCYGILGTTRIIMFKPKFSWWLHAKQVISHYLNQWWPSLLLYICLICFEGVNILQHYEWSYLHISNMFLYSNVNMMGGKKRNIITTDQTAKIIPETKCSYFYQSVILNIDAYQ